MSNVHPQKPTPSKGGAKKKRWARRIIESWPLAVWLGVIVITLYAWKQGVSFNQMNGSVGVYQESLSPLETGRLVEVLVSPGQEVSRGDILARMDTSLIDKEIEELKREIAADKEDRLRRFTSVVLDFEEQLRKLKRDQAGDAAQLAAVTTELTRLEELLSRNLILEEVVADKRIEKAALTAVVAIYPEQIDEVTTSLDAARTQVTKVKDSGGGSHNAAEELRELDLLNQQKEFMNLRAVRDGVVFRIEKEPGEVIVAGEAVVRIVSDAEQISAFLPQERLRYVNVGDTVWVSPTYDRHTSYQSIVSAISPRIINTPDVASPLPNKMLHGREVIVELPEEGGFPPGQTVIVHLEQPGEMTIGALLSNDRPPSPSAVPPTRKD